MKSDYLVNAAALFFKTDGLLSGSTFLIFETNVQRRSMVAFKNVLVFVILTKITQINYRCCLVVQKIDGHVGLKKEYKKNRKKT